MKVVDKGSIVDVTIRCSLRTMANQIEHPNLNDKVSDRIEARLKLAESLRKLSNGRYANRLLCYGE